MADPLPPGEDGELGVVTTAFDLRQQRDQLDRRLSDGWDKIDQGIAAGQSVEPWETFWISLLAEYESVCNALAETDG